MSDRPCPGRRAKASSWCRQRCGSAHSAGSGCCSRRSQSAVKPCCVLSMAPLCLRAHRERVKCEAMRVSCSAVSSAASPAGRPSGTAHRVAPSMAPWQHKTSGRKPCGQRLSEMWRQPAEQGVKTLHCAARYGCLRQRYACQHALPTWEAMRMHAPQPTAGGSGQAGGNQPVHPPTAVAEPGKLRPALCRAPTFQR